MEHYIRKGDGLILVCQNNEAASLTVQEVNPIFCEMTGFETDEVEQRSLKDILGKKLQEYLEDYLEFEDDAHDMQQVLSKVARNEFMIRCKNGQEKAVHCKIVRSNAYDRHQWFRLILQDERYYREEDAKRAILAENFRGYEKLDAQTQLPDKATLEKDMELVQHYVSGAHMSALYVLVRLDDYNHMMGFGKEVATKAINHVASALRRNLRADDRICLAEGNVLGLILTDITLESARVVLNRLRWQVVSDRMRIKDGVSTSLNISVAYCPITEHEQCTAIMKRCASALAAMKTPNAMVEVHPEKVD